MINYQTQQYRLFPALAATYAMSFTGWTFRKMLMKIQDETNRFKDIDLNELGKVKTKLLDSFFNLENFNYLTIASRVDIRPESDCVW